MSGTLSILGSGSALPTTERNPSSQLLEINHRHFLIDCGEGTQIQLIRLNKSYMNIHHIFISHAHGDHIFGLPGLIATMSMLGRNKSLHIYSTPTIKEFLNHAFVQGISELPFSIELHELPQQRSLIFEDEKVQVISFPLSHRVPCHGFLFKEISPKPNIRKEKIEAYGLTVKEILAIKDGADYTTPKGHTIPNQQMVIPPPPPTSYAYCTDTRYVEDIIPIIQNVTTLYHEATFASDMHARAIKTFHSTAEQAADIALKANVNQLLIGHFSSRYVGKSNRLEEEAKSVFPNTHAVSDGDVFHF